MHALHCYILRELTAKGCGAIACQLHGCCFWVNLLVSVGGPHKVDTCTSNGSPSRWEQPHLQSVKYARLCLTRSQELLIIDSAYRQDGLRPLQHTFDARFQRAAIETANGVWPFLLCCSVFPLRRMARYLFSLLGCIANAID